MKGFDDKALILFPKSESYDQRSNEYKANFRLAVGNLVDYLLKQNITPHVFYTDDVAHEVFLPSMKYVSPLGPGDLFFAAQNCVGLSDARRQDLIRYPDAYAVSEKRVPVISRDTVEERFSDVLSRTSIAEREIIKQYHIVCHFIRRGNPAYKLVSKSGDGRIILEIDAITFLPTAYMSGYQPNLCNLLNVPYGNRSLLVWRTVQ